MADNTVMLKGVIDKALLQDIKGYRNRLAAAIWENRRLKRELAEAIDARYDTSWLDDLHIIPPAKYGRIEPSYITVGPEQIAALWAEIQRLQASVAGLQAQVVALQDKVREWEGGK